MRFALFKILVVFGSLPFAACDPGTDGESPIARDEAMAKLDRPILPVTPGDTWVYETRLEIPQGVSSLGAAEVETIFRRTRTYLGKISAAAGLPEKDCFEVVVPGAPDEREFVDIQNDRIDLWGSLIMRPESTQPMWLESPVLFVMAGMKAGTTLPELRTFNGGLARTTRVIAREDLTVAAGRFSCIRLLTTGDDGDVELRKTLWFSPGHGIVREEKTRYRRNQLIYRETQELTVIKMARSLRAVSGRKE